MNKRELARYSFMKSIPILCSYLFVSMAYGILMEESGFPWYDSLLVSLTVYTGAFQFVLTSLLSAGASVITIGLTACFMNSRQTFYSLTFVDVFNRMGKRKPYMIHTMTDETYAVNCTLDLPEKERPADSCFHGWNRLLHDSALCDDLCRSVGKSTLPFSGSGRTDYRHCLFDGLR